MKKTPKELVNSRRLELPKKSVARLLLSILKIKQFKSDVSYVYHFDKKEMKGKQVILIADHATRNAYIHVLSGYKFIMPNIVVGYQNIFIKFLFKLLLKVGVIPKKLYQADRKSVVEMLSALKLGGSLCFFPEGIQSNSGSTHPIFSATGKFLKKAGVTVVLCKSFGSYLVRPRYKKSDNRGRQEFHYEILFNEQQLKEMTVEEIDKRLLERFQYNDFEWNKIHRNKYFGKQPLAQDIENIIYYCPKCCSEFTITTEGEDIVCNHCHNAIHLNEYYDLSPKTEKDYLPYTSIDEWFKAQRKLVKEEVKSMFCYEYECEIYDIHTDKTSIKPFYCCGEGTMTLTNEGLRYRGTRHNENVDLFFDVKSVPSFVFTPNQDNDLYFNDVYYSFRPKKDRIKVVKYMLLVEESHCLVDDTWKKISESVYGE